MEDDNENGLIPVEKFDEALQGAEIDLPQDLVAWVKVYYLDTD